MVPADRPKPSAGITALDDLSLRLPGLAPPALIQSVPAERIAVMRTGRAASSATPRSAPATG